MREIAGGERADARRHDDDYTRATPRGVLVDGVRVFDFVLVPSGRDNVHCLSSCLYPVGQTMCEDPFT